MKPFEYPGSPHVRQHGPQGYVNYSEYRDWVRDEFAFRCVYCLLREVWLGSATFFHLDHAVAQKHQPDLASAYDNLLYLCAGCNGKKQACTLPDPCSTALADCLEVKADGTITAKNCAGRRLVKVLRLDSPDLIELRRKMILLGQDPNHSRSFLCYPLDLPDLRRRKPKVNTKPNGAENCHFARRERGELEETY